MANILQIEDAIIDRLNDRLGEYTDAINASLPPEQAISINVSELPLNPAEIGVPVSATQIWVAFREESFDPPPTGGVSNPLKPPSQGRRITYEVIIRGQQLRLKNTSGYTQSWTKYEMYYPDICLEISILQTDSLNHFSPSKLGLLIWARDCGSIR